MNNIKKILFMLMIVVVISLSFMLNVKADSSKVDVVSITTKDKNGAIEVSDPVFVDNTIKSNITFNKVNDYVSFEVILKNNDNKFLKIDNVYDNNSNSNIIIEYEYNNNTINPGDEAKINIKLTYKNQLLNQDSISINDLKINIDLIDSDVKGDTIVIPDTIDNVFKYLALLVISLIIIVAITIVAHNKKIKLFTCLFVLVAALVLVPFITKAKTTVKLQLVFNNITIKGEFETYNVIINPNDGSDITIKQIKYGDKVEDLPANPSKDGYTFAGWTDQDGNNITNNTVITKPITITAQYTINNYTISYDLKGGSLPQGKTNPTNYNIESDDITLNNPTKQGYTFIGWTGSNGEVANVNVTIETGSKGNKNYVANFSANANTPYTVIHKYENLNGGYDEVTRNLTGETDKTIEVAIEAKTGYTTPEVKTLKITADPVASLTYTYNLLPVEFSITDRTYIKVGSAANDTYKYGTTINVEAVNRAGYDFIWSDGETEYAREITLTEDKTLSTIYVAKTNIPYRVEHYKMNFAEGDYTLDAYQDLTGTTDSSITPEVNTYTGFTSPDTQTTTISGDGDTVVKYYYDRKKAHLTVNDADNVVEGDISGNYYYGQQVTLTAKELDYYEFLKWSNNKTNNPLTMVMGLDDIEIEPIYIKTKALVTFDTDGGSDIDSQVINLGSKATKPSTKPTKDGYRFRGWYTDDTYSTVFDFTNTTISDDITIYAKFEKREFITVFSHPNECTFNGPNAAITGDNCEYANNSNKYIDTGIQLYNTENHDKDYEIGFTIVNYDPSIQINQATFMNTKYEEGSFPGLVFRRRNATTDLDLSSRTTSSRNTLLYFNYQDITSVKIYRIYNEETEEQEIFYSFNGAPKVKLNDLSSFNPIFNLNVWFGATPTNGSATVAQRHLKGTLKDMYIKVGVYLGD